MVPTIPNFLLFDYFQDTKTPITMKKILVALLFITATFLFTQDANAQKTGPEKTRVLLADSTQLLAAYPMDVLSIVTNKCLGCHSPKGKSDKAKKALQWVELQYAEPADLVAKLDEIQEVVVEGEMPPKKMVEKYPHLKMTDEEIALITEWTESTINAAMGE